MNKDRCVHPLGAKAEDNANLYWKRSASRTCQVEQRIFGFAFLVMKKLEDTGKNKPGREAGWGEGEKRKSHGWRGFPGGPVDKTSCF